ncbi:MAG: hypothetical protein U5K38_00185 [Woeseiaceae bacterium]|nr:hypothetical protein [Woeseiaceae bacterium]
MTALHQAQCCRRFAEPFLTPVDRGALRLRDDLDRRPARHQLHVQQLRKIEARHRQVVPVWQVTFGRNSDGVCAGFEFQRAIRRLPNERLVDRDEGILRRIGDDCEAAGLPSHFDSERAARCVTDPERLVDIVVAALPGMHRAFALAQQQPVAERQAEPAAGHRYVVRASRLDVKLDRLGRKQQPRACRQQYQGSDHRSLPAPDHGRPRRGLHVGRTPECLRCESVLTGLRRAGQLGGCVT